MASSSSRSLEQTPSWAVALVCFTIISISILLEYFIHFLSNWLKRHGKKSLNGALEKLKSELMVLGFISLLLAVAQRPISKICIPTNAADTMLPCRKLEETTSNEKRPGSGEIHRNLIWVAGDNGENIRRLLSGESSANPDHCSSRGMVSLITVKGLQQLQIFIFVLAAMHVGYSVLTMTLGRAKMNRWKGWEKETQTTEYQASNDPNRFRFIRQTTFVKRYLESFWIKTSLNLWIKCFFRQFFNSVAKVDYITLRHGFIAAHLPPAAVFNFQKYIQRSLEDDFKVVVGVSPIMWFLVVIFMLLDVHGWYIYFWLSFIPLIIVLAVGTKLQLIVARMALQLQDQNTVVKGALQVHPSDDFFWFGRPKLVLLLLHFTLFQNSFELAFFVWIWFEFGLKSCYHEKFEIIIIRVFMAISVQILTSYVTLPLYALITQMGSQYKRSIFEEQTAQILRQWHRDVRDRNKRQHSPSNSNSPRISTSIEMSYQRVDEKIDTPEEEITSKQEIIPQRLYNRV